MHRFALFLLCALVTPAFAAPATNAELCRSQHELLLSGNKLTPEESATFKRQCDCLERNPNGPCTEEQLD